MRMILAAAMVACVALVGLAQAVAVPGPDQETGTQLYARYQAAIPKATKLDELQAFWSADLVKQFNAAPPEQRVDLEGMKRMYGMMTAVKVVKETSSTTGATLTLEGVTRDGKQLTNRHRVPYQGERRLEAFRPGELELAVSYVVKTGRLVKSRRRLTRDGADVAELTLDATRLIANVRLAREHAKKGE